MQLFFIHLTNSNVIVKKHYDEDDTFDDDFNRDAFKIQVMFWQLQQIYLHQHHVSLEPLITIQSSSSSSSCGLCVSQWLVPCVMPPAHLHPALESAPILTIFTIYRDGTFFFLLH